MRITLSQSYTFGGVTYGPGEADVPDRVAHYLAAAERASRKGSAAVSRDRSDGGNKGLPAAPAAPAAPTRPSRAPKPPESP